MEYTVDILTISGEFVAEDKYSQFVSSDPLLVPNVGDLIYVPTGCGLDYKQAQTLKVMKRQFTYAPGSELAVHVELFCQDNASKD